jgi:hypothetical protein
LGCTPLTRYFPLILSRKQEMGRQHHHFHLSRLRERSTRRFMEAAGRVRGTTYQ